MDSTKIQASFSINGDVFDPNDITRELGINPTKAWKKGEKGKLSHIMKNSFWEISTKYEESDDIDIQLHKIYELLKNKKHILNQIRENNDVQYSFFVVVEVENKQLPALALHSWIIEFTCELKAEIEFDYYHYS